MRGLPASRSRAAAFRRAMTVAPIAILRSSVLNILLLLSFALPLVYNGVGPLPGEGVLSMADATLDAVERVLDEVDKSRDVDWSILGERLRSAILDSGEHVDAGFTEAIVAVCRETYYAASVVARAYAFKAVEALLDRSGE